MPISWISEEYSDDDDCGDCYRDDDDDKSDNSDDDDTFALTSRQKDLQRRKMQETILAAAEGTFQLRMLDSPHDTAENLISKHVQ